MEPGQFTQLLAALTNIKAGGKSDVIIPSITTSAAAYSSGDVVGGLITLGNIVRFAKGTGVLKSIHVTDSSGSAAPLTILIFSETPSGATYTDNSAFAYGATALSKQIAKINVGSSDYETINGESVADIDTISKVLRSTGDNGNLYAVVLTTGTPTFGAGTGILTIKYGILQD